jgi:uncharacterized phage protein (predicted DNA packaging)
MAYITLELVKQHLNIDAGYPGDDTYLNHLIGVAQDVMQHSIHRYLSDLQDASGDIPAAIVQAMLIYIADLYNNRESVAYGATPTTVPRSYDYLVALYTDYSNNENEI